MRPEVRFLRKNVFDFIQNDIFKNSWTPGESVLEIGPMQLQWTPVKEYFVDTKKFFEERAIKYISNDIDETSEADVICSILELDKFIAPKSLDAIIALEVVEHVSKIWELQSVFSRVLKPRGKLFLSTPYYFFRHSPFPDYWRISEDGLRLLFDEKFDLKIVPLVLEDERKPLHYTMVATMKAE